MNSIVIPFTRALSVNPAGSNARMKAPDHPAPTVVGGNSFPAELEALAASHANDLRVGSVAEWLDGLTERARDERSAYAHRPIGVIADIAFDGLLKVKADLDATIRSLSTRAALAEAKELAASLDDQTPEEALTAFRFMTKAQREAVTWALAQDGQNGPEAA